MLKDFKAFAMKGNVIDMAVGIVIGAAFGKIIASFVKDILMPPIGMLMGGLDFSQLYLNLTDVTYESLAAAQEAGAATINYGVFINFVVDFLIVAFAIFMVVRQMAKLKRKPEEAPAVPTTKDCPQCLSTVPIKASRCAHCTSQLSAA